MTVISIVRFSFGNLFSGPESGRTGQDAIEGPKGPGQGSAGGAQVNMKYSSSGEEEGGAVGPALSTMRAKSSEQRKSRGMDLFDGDSM